VLDRKQSKRLPPLYTDFDDDTTDDETGQMTAKKSRSRSRQHQPNGSASSAFSPSASASDMNGSFRERQKHHSPADIPEDSALQTARLMERSSFTLDEAPPPISPSELKGLAGGDEGSKGFFELPEQDRRNFLLLVGLYFLQGIPMGLAGGSVPFLLKSHMSYGQIGVYSLASYPYSLKLLWSPIVDAIWSPRVGRRKSWILPIQALSGLGMIWLGRNAQAMMEKAGEDNGAGVWGFTGWWFALVFMCATQDIAVDGKSGLSNTPSPTCFSSTKSTVLNTDTTVQAGPSPSSPQPTSPTPRPPKPSASQPATSSPTPFSSPSPPQTSPTNTSAPPPPPTAS